MGKGGRLNAKGWVRATRYDYSHAIYGTRSKLIVVFLGASYAQKEWCGIEFRVVREIIKSKNDAMVMYVRHDDGKVPDVLSTDGYIDALTHTPAEVAGLIMERVKLKQLA